MPDNAASQRAPRLSVGLPVYNGQRFLRAALESILAQTFRDFELIICDNASTDATEQICHECAARDARVRYFRHPANIGPAANYNACFRHARGELFRWAAHDDVIAPELFQLSIDALDRDPGAVAVYPNSCEIDAEGKRLFDHATRVELEDTTVARRLASYLFVDHRKGFGAVLWSVMRADVLRQWSPLKGSFPSADRAFIVNVLLRGKMLRLEPVLFFNREHGDRSQSSFDRTKVRPGSRLVKYLGCGPVPGYAWWDETKKGKIVFPEWRWLREYYRAVTGARLSLGDKLGCYGALALLTVRFAPRLVRDLIIATEQFFNRATGLGPQAPAAPTHPLPATPTRRAA
jgi:glycosyltransferase involved in cell wall biosynthesis